MGEGDREAVEGALKARAAPGKYQFKYRNMRLVFVDSDEVRMREWMLQLESAGPPNRFAVPLPHTPLRFARGRKFVRCPAPTGSLVPHWSRS
jgi:hypothetical protein